MERLTVLDIWAEPLLIGETRAVESGGQSDVVRVLLLLAEQLLHALHAQRLALGTLQQGRNKGGRRDMDARYCSAGCEV